MFHECDYMLNVGAELRKVGVKLVLFDLGNALGCRNQYKSSPGPRATSRALESVTDSEGRYPVSALVSDFGEPQRQSRYVPVRKNNDALLEHLEIRDFFTPTRGGSNNLAYAGAFRSERKLVGSDQKNHRRVLRMQAVSLFSPGEITRNTKQWLT